MPADERIGFDIKRTEQALMAAKAAALREFDLTVAQYAALFTLAANPGMSGAALARACLVTPQAMASVLRTLEERGLVVRSAHPWHQHVLESRLSGAGQRVLAEADLAAVRIERRIADSMSAPERRLLRELLARCTDAIRTGEPATADRTASDGH